jgi:hypothetical protein
VLKSVTIAPSSLAITSHLITGITEASVITSGKTKSLATGKSAPSRTMIESMAGAKPATVQEDDTSGVGAGI